MTTVTVISTPGDDGTCDFYLGDEGIDNHAQIEGVDNVISSTGARTLLDVVDNQVYIMLAVDIEKYV